MTLIEVSMHLIERNLDSYRVILCQKQANSRWQSTDVPTPAQNPTYFRKAKVISGGGGAHPCTSPLGLPLYIQLNLSHLPLPLVHRFCLLVL